MNEKLMKIVELIPEEKRDEFAAKFQKCADKESLLALAADFGIPVDEELTAAITEILSKRNILSDEDLETVAGGSITYSPGDIDIDGAKRLQELIC